MPFDIRSFYDEVYRQDTGGDGPSSVTTVSVFDAGYISSSKAASTGVRTGYFALGTGTSVASLATLGGLAGTTMKASSGTMSSAANFWQIIITGIVEEHAEKSLVHNTLSENVSVFAAGAMPVQVSITGLLLLSATDNHHFGFLKRYVDELRARRLSLEDRTCLFVSKDTSFKLIIEALVLGTSVENEAYADISIQGHACGYRMTDSKDPLRLNYYGKESPVPTSAAKKGEAGDTPEEQPSSSDPETRLKPSADTAPASALPRKTIRV